LVNFDNYYEPFHYEYSVGNLGMMMKYFITYLFIWVTMVRNIGTKFSLLLISGYWLIIVGESMRHTRNVFLFN